MPLVEALQQFDHGSEQKRRGDQFRVSDPVAREFERRGLAKIISHMGVARPKKPAGTPPSASPAGQASPQTTAIVSEAGAALARTPRRARNPPPHRTVPPPETAAEEE